MGFGSDRSVKLTVAATMDGFVNELDRAGRSGQQFSKNIVASTKAAAKSLTSVKDAAKEVAVPLLAVGTVAAAGVGYAVKSYADFDEKMSSVKSLSHATAGEMTQLKEAALTSGTAIGYSATQAAEAEIEARQSWCLRCGHLRWRPSGSLKLAAAGQIDVADATSIAASTLTQFGLQGKDVTHVADLLSAGADKALGGVSELGEGLKYIGPVAASAHVGLEQTVGSLALLAQNGILGEQAGTSLRGMLLSLTAPSQLAAKTMQTYGIEVYNAQGKFVGFNGVAEQLHTKLGTLDDATRDLALGQIFGNAQITAATILMNGGAAAVDKWTVAVNEQGFATEQAVGKMDNLNGDLTKLKASFQTAAIVTGEAADGPCVPRCRSSPT
ncbi:phage tail tape measure protein [Curtobacterium flaccumfaciens]|nr:phage tail tape measure protein [Curtobacterium flaccumfaciens]